MISAASPSKVEMVKNLPALQEIRVQSLGWEDPLEKGTATRSNILTWRIPGTEEPGRLESMRGCKGSFTTELLTLSHFYFQMLMCINKMETLAIGRILLWWHQWLNYILVVSCNKNNTNWGHNYKLAIFKNSKYLEFPGDPVVRILRLHCRGPRFNPWSGN